MDENHIEQLLRENKKLLEENNEILHKLHSYQKWQRAWRIMYWVLILGSIFGAYFVLQQYLINLGLSPETVKKYIENPTQLLIPGIGDTYPSQ